MKHTLSTPAVLKLTEEQFRIHLQMGIRMFDLGGYILAQPWYLNSYYVVDWAKFVKAIDRPADECWLDSIKVLGDRTSSRFGDDIFDWLYSSRYGHSPLYHAYRMFFYLCGNRRYLPKEVHGQEAPRWPAEFHKWLKEDAMSVVREVRDYLGLPQNEDAGFVCYRPREAVKAYPELPLREFYAKDPLIQL